MDKEILHVMYVAAIADSMNKLMGGCKEAYENTGDGIFNLLYALLATFALVIKYNDVQLVDKFADHMRKFVESLPDEDSASPEYTDWLKSG